MRISDLTHGSKAPLRSKGAGELASFIVLMAVLLLLPSLGAPNQIIYLVVLCMIWAIASYGLFIPFAIAGSLTIATITVFGAASFAVALAANYWGWGISLLIPLGIVAGIVASAIVALPILRTSGHYFVVVTFAVAQLGVIAGGNWKLLDNNNSGVIVTASPQVFGWDLLVRRDMLQFCALCLTIVFLAVFWLRRSRLGRRLAAVRENEDLIRTVGCSVTKYKFLALMLGGAVTGFAAPLNVFFLRNLQVSAFGVLPGIAIVVIVVLGGRKNVLGPIVGALFWYLGPQLIGVDALIGQALFGAVLIAAILLFPNGLVPAVARGFRALGRVTFRFIRKSPRGSLAEDPAPADLSIDRKVPARPGVESAGAEDEAKVL